MSHYFRYECFCTLAYDNELTYEEVMEREADLQERMQEILERCGAKYIDFIPVDDLLQIQCVFEECGADDFRFLCAEVAELTVDGVRGRMLLVSKGLEEISFALFADGKPLLSTLPVPEPVSSAKKIAFAPKHLVPLTSAERDEARDYHLPPAPEPEQHIRQRRAGPGVHDGLGSTWINTDLIEQANGGAPGIDPVMLLQAWREQMHKRAEAKKN